MRYINLRLTHLLTYLPQLTSRDYRQMSLSDTANNSWM